ncbi:MAG: helix-turn-helix domain-containing protein, partial [Candidatus Woesearchaeota archaeon]
MLSETELRILKMLFEDLTKDYTIRELSKALKLPYPQAHRSIQSLAKRDIIKKTKKGKSSVISLDF